MEPPSKGHFGTNHSVYCREDVLFSESSTMGFATFESLQTSVLYEGCPFLGGSFIRDSIVLVRWNTMAHFQFSPFSSRALYIVASLLLCPCGNPCIHCNVDPFPGRKRVGTEQGDSQPESKKGKFKAPL